MNHKKIPIKYDELKLMLRSGLDVYDNNNNNNNDNNNLYNNLARIYWWPLLITLEKGKTIETYPDIKSIAKRLYDMVEDKGHQYILAKLLYRLSLLLLLLLLLS